MKGLHAHWDKLVLGVAIVLGVVLIVFGVGMRGERATFAPMSPAKDVRAESNAIDYAVLIAEVSGRVADQLEPNVLAHEYLQRCPSCKKLQRRWTVTCPECGARVSYAEDSDGDGIPNEWERKYGLDWTNPADGDEDPDGDGLTNLEEYKRGSNPRDPQDPNLIADEYRLVSVSKPVRPVMFVHFNKTGAGTTLQIRYRGNTLFKRTGDVIAERGTNVYKVGELREKFEMVWNPQVNSSQRVDRSELTMTDLVNNEQFVMVKGMTNYEPRVEAKLVNLSSGTEVVVREGDRFMLPKIQREATVVKLRDDVRQGEFKVGNITYSVRVE